MPGRKTGGFTKIVTVTPTIQAAAYATGELVGGKMSFAGAVRMKDLVAATGLIQSVVITDLGKQSVALDLVFFDTDPSNTTFTENSALAVNDTDLLTVVGVASVTDWKSLSDNSVGLALNLAMPFNLGTGTVLYGALVSRGAPTYASTSDLTVRVGILQD